MATCWGRAPLPSRVRAADVASGETLERLGRHEAAPPAPRCCSATSPRGPLAQQPQPRRIDLEPSSCDPVHRPVGPHPSQSATHLCLAHRATARDRDDIAVSELDPSGHGPEQRSAPGHEPSDFVRRRRPPHHRLPSERAGTGARRSRARRRARRAPPASRAPARRRSAQCARPKWA